MDSDIESLIEASSNGDLERVRQIIEGGVDVNAQGAHGNTALVSSFAFGDHLELVRYLISLGVDVDYTGMEEGTPLMLAAFGGKAEHMQLFIDAGADVNLSMPVGGETALHDAAVKGHTDAVKLLIAAGADVNKTTNIDAATSMFAGRKLMGETPLHFAAAFGDVAMIVASLDAGADKSIANSNSELASDCAIQEKRSDEILALLRDPG